MMGTWLLEWTAYEASLQQQQQYKNVHSEYLKLM